MARINTNVPSLIARSQLLRNNHELEFRLQRLSTGLRINRGADDPAGLITSERIRSDIKGVQQGVDNAERASSVISTSEASLAEVSDLLNSIKALIVQSANTGGTSTEERDANQQQIDSAIDSITRISNTASFGGLKLLNGSLDYTLSSVNTTEVARAQVFGASFVAASRLRVDVDVLASAQVGALFMRGDYSGANAAFNGTILSTTTLRIAGARGVSELTLVSGTTLSDVVQAVNNLTSLTGIQATLLNPLDNTSGLTFQAIDYGSQSFVSVERLGGSSNAAANYFATYKFAEDAQLPAFPFTSWATLISAGDLTQSNRDPGRDVTALVNGTLATGNGLALSVNSPALSLKLLLDESYATSPPQPTSSFYVTGGGALFQLGPEVTAQQQSNVGVQSIAASSLGGTLQNGSLQFLNSLKSGSDNSVSASVSRNNFTGASDVLENAIDDIAILRGRLGAFERNVLQTNVRSLQSAFENLTASESKIRDADFAEETSQLTRAQILSSAGTSVLALANQQSQQVLQLLG
ncbi:MAG: flagellin [Phycisphaerales bacterium]|nr:flagellin [Phycisphaerales bacterium]